MARGTLPVARGTRCGLSARIASAALTNLHSAENSFTPLYVLSYRHNAAANMTRRHAPPHILTRDSPRYYPAHLHRLHLLHSGYLRLRFTRSHAYLFRALPRSLFTPPAGSLARGLRGSMHTRCGYNAAGSPAGTSAARDSIAWVLRFFASPAYLVKRRFAAACISYCLPPLPAGFFTT